MCVVVNCYGVRLSANHATLICQLQDRGQVPPPPMASSVTWGEHRLFTSETYCLECNGLTHVTQNSSRLTISFQFYLLSL